MSVKGGAFLEVPVRRTWGTNKLASEGTNKLASEGTITAVVAAVDMNCNWNDSYDGWH